MDDRVGRALRRVAAVADLPAEDVASRVGLVEP
jgi:hypothetical protein